MRVITERQASSDRGLCRRHNRGRKAFDECQGVSDGAINLTLNCLFGWGGCQSAPSPYIMVLCVIEPIKGYEVPESEGGWLLVIISLGRAKERRSLSLKSLASQ